MLSGAAGEIDGRYPGWCQVVRACCHSLTVGATCDPGRLAYIRECSVAIVVVQGMSSVGQPAWPAFHGNAFPVAIAVLPGHGSVFEGETNIVGDEQIQVAIPVVVQEAAPCAPARLLVPQAGGFGYIGKGSVAIVAIKPVLSEAGDEDVFESVVVIVADANSGGPIPGTQAGFLGNVGDGSVGVVVVSEVA